MGRPVEDLTGQKFGRLTVIERDMGKPRGQGKSAYWICQCQCGNIKSVRTDKLRNGDTRSCGCLQQETRGKVNLINLTGHQFGRLTVLERDFSKPIGKSCPAYWICKCQCGNIVSVRSDHLRDKTTSSCGCLNSSGEEKITQIFQEHNVNYITQYEFTDLKGDYNNLRFDFAVFNNNNDLQYLVEFQGSQHFRKWGNEDIERFKKRLEYDQKKRDYCKQHNILLLEIPYTDFDILNWEYFKRMEFNE